MSPSILLYKAYFPSRVTERDTRPNVCGGGKVAFGDTGWPVGPQCLIDPSAEIENAVSSSVYATPQTASVWANRASDEPVL